MAGTVILSGARTPIGKLSGSLASLSAVDLGAVAIKEALTRAGVTPEQVDYVFMGHVLQAGQGQITARQAAAGASIPMDTPSTTVNKVCLSGMNAIYLADLMINAGEADIVVAGGMESMTRAPYLLDQARQGYRLGNATIVDSMMYDGLTCAFDHCAMGKATDSYNTATVVSRERQDAFAALSHERAANAQKNGRFALEIAPVSIPQRKGDPVTVDSDEGIRPGTTAESLSGLKPAFSPDGTITAGNASQISDGAAAVIVTSRDTAERLGAEPLGEISGYGQVAGPNASLLHQPSSAIRKALERAGRSIGDVDLFEINEAFAAVGLASMDDLGIDSQVCNLNGGAIALGHPLGASGARLVVTLLYEMKARGAALGAAGLCGGGGQGDAIILSATR
ncbi:MAG: acetyl-CoA C-acetyltransferase [Actinobacteria bacterium]|nr:acetyl-CoA C-acetyltransferase [Actinomycetota bacterium]